MPDQDLVTNAMATLMPFLRKAFQKGLDKQKLSDVVRVKLNESATNVRLSDPMWPTGQHDLLEAPGAPVKALRLCRQVHLPGVAADAERQKALETIAEQFGEETAAAYVRAVLTKLVVAAQPAAQGAKPPDKDVLHKHARALGMPCRVIAGKALYEDLQELSDPYVEKVHLEPDWPPQQALVVSQTSKGPWVEELEPQFVVTWDRAAAGAASLQASRRLYLNQIERCVLYRP